MQIDPKFLKKIDSLLEVQQENNILSEVNGQELTYSLCNRVNTGDYGANYFLSFQLPYVNTYFSTGCTLSMRYPELQQLNVDEIIIAPIPPQYYSEMIDGRSIILNIPQQGYTYNGSLSGMSAITLYSNTYTGDQVLKKESSPLLGDNIAFLFADAINTPYTGTSTDSIGNQINHAGNNTWGVGSFPTQSQLWQRPSATGWKEAEFTYNTDQRTNANYSVPVPTNYPDGRAGYNYDIPVGFICLDEGFIVLTHTAITQNFPWGSGYTQNNSLVPFSETTNPSYLKNIYFTGITVQDLRPFGPADTNEVSSVEFNNIETSFKITAVCLALPTEFYVSNNPTWNKDSAVVNINEQSGFISFDPLYITELGLYNIDNELIAVAKTSAPIEKDYTGVITFNVDIEF